MRIKNYDRFATPPRALLIDIDNTLYSYERAHLNALSRVRELVSSELELAGQKFDEVFEQARSEVKKNLRDNPSSRNRLLYFQRMFELIGNGSAVLNSLNCEQTYWNHFLLEAELYNGVKEFFEEARLINIPVIAVTNLTAQIQFRKLVYFKLTEHIDFVVTSEQVGCEKPHKVIFDAALLHAGCEGEAVWMIGDDLKCDMEGAKSAISATTVLKYDSSNRSFLASDFVDAYFSTFGGLTRFLRKISYDYK